jgi:hypothetical protein
LDGSVFPIPEVDPPPLPGVIGLVGLNGTSGLAGDDIHGGEAEGKKLPGISRNRFGFSIVIHGPAVTVGSAAQDTRGTTKGMQATNKEMNLMFNL